MTVTWTSSVMPEMRFIVNTPEVGLGYTLSSLIVKDPVSAARVPPLQSASDNTVTGCIANAVPQAFVWLYWMFAIPGDFGVTKPAGFTLATNGLLLLHTPPGVASERLMKEPMHTTDGPVMVPVPGTVTILMDLDATDVPHTLDTLYIIVSVPVAIPVTNPPATVALPFVALQVPPPVASVSINVPPRHTLDDPMMMPGSGNVRMEIAVVVVAEPQTLATV